MKFDQMGFTIVEVPPLSDDSLSAYDTLPLDPYTGGNFRYRRFSQFKMEFDGANWTPTLLPPRPFVQSKTDNKLVGGVQRVLEPVNIDLTPQSDICANAISLATSASFHLNVHQVRVMTNREIDGIVVPEGPHRDGHEVGMTMVFRRRDISGGVTQLMPLGGGQPFFETILDENQAIIFEDAKMFHHATNILPLGEHEGFRDVCLVALNHWENRRYGEAHERRVMAAT